MRAFFLFRTEEGKMEIPKDLKYTESDEWLRIDGATAVTGISDFAQDQLSDIVYVEISVEVGDTLAKGEAYGLVESVKAAADLYMPVSGKIQEINEDLTEKPEAVNSDPYGSAWMVKFEITEMSELDDLLDAAAYTASIEERSA
jgi:glycine cleavage system H protein